MTEDPLSYGDIDAQFQRLMAAAGCRTQHELAALLSVSQAAVSDARRRGAFPGPGCPFWRASASAPRGRCPVPGPSTFHRLPPSPGRSRRIAHYPQPENSPPGALILRHILACLPSQCLEEELKRRNESG